MTNRNYIPLTLAFLTLAVTAPNTRAQSVYTPYAFTNFAGLPGVAGSADGTGTNAQFYGLHGVALDSAGNVYVADESNFTIRKITPAGVVTTLAGSAGVAGSADGNGTNAQFYHPTGVVVDSAGNIFIADQYNHTIRKMSRCEQKETAVSAKGGSL